LLAPANRRQTVAETQSGRAHADLICDGPREIGITRMNESATGDKLQQIIVSWVQKNIGPVVRVERQGRWRPAWFVDAVKDGRTLPLYLRGDRGGRGWPHMPLSYENKVFKIFEAGGVRVPHIYGYIDEIPAIVMDAAPGRVNLRTADNESDRNAVRSQLIDQMILIHSIDPELLRAAGAPYMKSAHDRALFYYRGGEEIYLSHKRRPAPTIEFIRGWIDRNMPDFPEQPKVVTVDSGQFMFERDRLTAMLDFEFAGLGDPHVDLASLRARTRAEYLGDIDELYRWYAERTGEKVDINRIRFHSVAFGTLSSLQMLHEIAEPKTGHEIHVYMIWDVLQLKDSLDNIFEINGWAPETFVPPESGPGSRYANLMVSLQQWLAPDGVADETARYARLKQWRVLRFLRRADAYQPQFEDEYLSDIAAVTGRRPANWASGDEQLEAFVRKAGASEDEPLLRLFMRQLLRRAFLLSDPDDTDSYETLTTSMQPIADTEGK